MRIPTLLQRSPDLAPRTGSDRAGGAGAVPRLPRPWTRRLRDAGRFVEGEAGKPAAFLVPARVFIGLGWLRACAEKVGDPGWWDGANLALFLDHQLARDAVAFTLYEQMIRGVFLPHAAALGLLVMLGQFLAGGAILAGAFTNAALLGALFMNANFLLAGAPNPSAFYVVIQVVLLAAQAGAVLGIDGELSRDLRSPWLVSQPPRPGGHPLVPRPVYAGTGGLLAAVSFLALGHVRDWSAGGSVEDPAMIVAVLCGMGAIWAAIGWVRSGCRDNLPSERTRGGTLTGIQASSCAPLSGAVDHGDQHNRERRAADRASFPGSTRTPPRPQGRTGDLLRNAPTRSQTRPIQLPPAACPRHGGNRGGEHRQ